jgi:hypothetical protein
MGLDNVIVRRGFYVMTATRNYFLNWIPACPQGSLS